MSDSNLRIQCNTMTETEIRGSERSPVFDLGCALGLQIVMAAYVARFVGIHAWDDGAITLAYSQTFAETGRIALTAASEQVEGFSSTAWFLINAFVFLFKPGFEGGILASQLAAAFFLGIATVFVWLIAQHLRLRPATTLAILVILSLFGPSISEVSNGMEMTLLAASGLALVYALYIQEHRLLLAVAIVIFLTTRFEAMIYYAVLLTPLLLRRRFANFVILAAIGLVVVGLQEVARYIAFNDVIPNTIYAKMHYPYSTSGLRALFSRVRAGGEIAHAVAPLVLALLAMIVFARHTLRARFHALAVRSDDFFVLAAPIVAVVCFSVLTGKNLGYVGRMQFFALPFALLLFGLLYEHLVSFKKERSAHAALIVLSLITIFFSWHQSAYEPIATMARALVNRNDGVTEHFGVTPASYRKTGLAVDRIRELLGKDTFVFVTPDVGGLGLCCNRVRVIDIGLLTNRRLAKEGYGALQSVLVDERPDVVEAHQLWATSSQIYELPEFKKNFQPILVDGTRLFLRNEHVQHLAILRHAQWCQFSDSRCLTVALEAHRSVEHTSLSDDAAFLQRGGMTVVVK